MRSFYTGATGLEPATSGVTGRYGATAYKWLRPGITDYSRHFLDAQTGCDRLRPAATRHRLCGRCVVEVVATSTTRRVGGAEPPSPICRRGDPRRELALSSSRVLAHRFLLRVRERRLERLRVVRHHPQTRSTSGGPLDQSELAPAGDGVGARGDAELAEDAAHVTFDRVQ
jgi:hypothetical protein